MSGRKRYFTEVTTLAGMLIVALLFRGGPTAIARLVISIIIDAVDLSFWPISHIGQEVVETAPALANGDPPPSIPEIILYVRIETAVQHCSPSAIFAGSSVKGCRKIRRMAVGFLESPSENTATAFGYSAHQQVIADRLHSAART